MSKQVWVIAKRPKVSPHFIMYIHGVVEGTRDEAQACADNANAWYGKHHPATPLEVLPNQVPLNPKPFPVAALQAGDMEAMFEDIDKD